ncbi:MAG: Fic family protein [Deltaproteobacteria bacterium]|nr:Fic family protein [Deltaproteobacteria bacterium]
MVDYYAVKHFGVIESLMQEIDNLQNSINEKRPLYPERWSAVTEKLKMEWTYDSNAIEGSTLTLGETIFFLREGLTVEGKPLKDFLDARNHVDAIDFMYDVVSDQRPVSEGLIKEVNALLLKGVEYTDAVDPSGKKTKKKATPGQYKKAPNTVIQLDGTIYEYTDPLHVTAEMEALISWINVKVDSEHGLLTGTVAHHNIARIHPFDDGNGRVARMLMNLIFMKKGLPPAVIRNELRRQYLDALSRADKGDMEPFVLFVGDALVKTQIMIIEELSK